jgi:hypothetical protein
MSQDQPAADFASKCRAIQIALLIVAIILVVIVSYKWISEYFNQCLGDCKTAHKTCADACNAPSIMDSVGSAVGYAKPVADVAAGAAAGAASGAVAGAASAFKSNKSPFSATKGQITDHELHSNFIDYGDAEAKPEEDYDYASMSLEDSVFQSHQEFVEDSYISSQGANMTDSVRDDLIYPNSWVGLRRPDMMSANSEDPTNRVVSSEYPEQVTPETQSSFVL